MLAQVGELASSKSVMNTRAPELSALMTILRSVGPVISTRRSWMSAGVGATVQSVPDVFGFRQEIGPLATVQRGLALVAAGEEFVAPVAEFPVQRGDEGHRFRREDFGLGGGDVAADFDAFRRGGGGGWCAQWLREAEVSRRLRRLAQISRRRMGKGRLTLLPFLPSVSICVICG